MERKFYQRTRMEWGIIVGDPDAEKAIFVASGAHGNEPTGNSVGVNLMNMVIRSSEGNTHHVCGPEGLAEVGPVDLEGFQFVFAPGLNPHGLAWGMFHTDSPIDCALAYSGKPTNVNRSWPNKIPITRQVWSEGLMPLCRPGRKVYALDVHGSYKGKHYVIATAECSKLIQEVDPEMTIVLAGSRPLQEPPEEEETTLEGAAVKAGLWACTIEVGEDTACAPLHWCSFFKKFLDVLRQKQDA